MLSERGWAMSSLEGRDDEPFYSATIIFQGIHAYQETEYYERLLRCCVFEQTAASND